MGDCKSYGLIGALCGALALSAPAHAGPKKQTSDPSAGRAVAADASGPPRSGSALDRAGDRLPRRALRSEGPQQLRRRPDEVRLPEQPLSNGSALAGLGVKTDGPAAGRPFGLAPQDALAGARPEESLAGAMDRARQPRSTKLHDSLGRGAPIDLGQVARPSRSPSRAEAERVAAPEMAASGDRLDRFHEGLQGALSEAGITRRDWRAPAVASGRGVDAGKARLGSGPSLITSPGEGSPDAADAATAMGLGGGAAGTPLLPGLPRTSVLDLGRDGLSGRTPGWVNKGTKAFGREGVRVDVNPVTGAVWVQRSGGSAIRRPNATTTMVGDREGALVVVKKNDDGTVTIRRQGADGSVTVTHVNKDGSGVQTVTRPDGTTTTVTGSGDGATVEVKKQAEDPAQQPAPDADPTAGPSSELVRKFAARRRALVNPAGPEEERVEADEGRMIKTLVGALQAKVNPAPDAPGSPSGTPGPKDPGVVDPLPGVSDPLPRVDKGPKPPSPPPGTGSSDGAPRSGAGLGVGP